MRNAIVCGAAGVLLFIGPVGGALGQERKGNDRKENGGSPAKGSRKPEQRARPKQEARQPDRQQTGQDQRREKSQPQLRSPAPRQAAARPEPPPQVRTWQEQRGWLQKGDGWKGRDTWLGSRAQRWHSDHRTWIQRGGYGGYSIPQDQYRLQFGSQHFFRIRSRPLIYQGYPRFSYGGYSFLLVDPWPEYWSDSWYDTDDVYIDYDDGYYLNNRSYPQVRLAITVVL